MDFIKIETIKNWLFALVQQDDCYLIMFGKILPLKLESKSNNNAIFYHGHLISEIACSNTASMIITFLEHNENLFTLIKLQNKDEYDTIIKIAEVIL